MKKEMDNVEIFLSEIYIVSEEIKKLSLGFHRMEWSSRDILSESSRKCLEDLVQEAENGLYKTLWKCEYLKEHFAKILGDNRKVVEEHTAEIIKNALNALKEKENG